MIDFPSDAKATLKTARKNQNLTLYLGAGVSAANGLPTWERLVLAMYYGAISGERMHGWRPFPNYLYAIAEWHLKRATDPLEITARKIRKYYPDQSDFLSNLRSTLYEPLRIRDVQEDQFQPVDPAQLRAANATLDAVARICESSANGHRGVFSVISYNYDCLLEAVLRDCPCQSVFGNVKLDPSKLPVYHVHGYVPLAQLLGDGDVGSAPEEIVFTEEQYHANAQDVYSWNTMIQIQTMARSVGLMVGLSLSDRNMRRLLDAIAQTPVSARNYAILQRPKWKEPKVDDLDEIHENAKKYYEKFERSGIKSDRGEEDVIYPRPGIKSAGPVIAAGVKAEKQYQREISGILQEVQRFDVDEQGYVLDQLGITPIWYDDHGEIPKIVDEILSD